MISSVVWLPRGAAKPAPQLVEPSEEELAAARSRAAAVAAGAADDAYDSDDGGDEARDADDTAADDSDSADEEAAVATARAAAAHLSVDASVEAALAELNMDAYDEEDEHVQTARLFGGSGPLTYYASNADDPYITLPDDDDDSDDRSSEFNLRDTDLIVLAARTEDDVSHLEVCVYEEATEAEEANLFVHHDLLLPAFPLTLAWLDCPPGATEGSARGNFVAIGTMLPGIEIWDLDLLDAVEPAAVLGDMMAGQPPPPSKSAKKKAKKKLEKEGAVEDAELDENTHTGAVMALAWNAEFRNVLASGSADTTVKVWDVVSGSCEHTLRHHTDKVQSLAWSTHTPSALLSGSFDQTAVVCDVRSAASGDMLVWQLGSDCECVAWQPGGTQALVSTEDGLVRCWDSRAGGGSSPLFTLAAHRKATCTLAMSAHAPGLLATGSTDKKTKLWDISTGAPEMLASQDVRVGAVFTSAFCRDAPHLLAVAGAQSGVSVWDVATEAEVKRRFPQLGTQ